jgi:predicted deacylase
MEQRKHPLQGLSIGTSRQVTSFHFGHRVNDKPKAYIQAGLHATELPGMLVAHHLREKLLEEEAHGRLLGEVVLVPVSNPIGLDQTLLGYQMGRFDLATGENFNRFFPDLSEQLAKELEGQLGEVGDDNVRLVRELLRARIHELPDIRAVDSLRKILLGLSCDADIVLDLHCDCESVLHLYTHSATIEDVMPLSALMEAHSTLYAEVQGNTPFDEVTVDFWLKLQKRFPHHPLPLPTVAATVELRGQLDVSHKQAENDADRILDYLRLKGVLGGRSAIHIPMPSHQATPLDGAEVLFAERAGIIVYLASCGDQLKPGDPVVEVIDPVTGEADRLHAGVEGVFFARQNRRYAMSGMDLAYIAGNQPIRAGNLLSA